MLSVEKRIKAAYPGYITVSEFAQYTGYSLNRAYGIAKQGLVERIYVRTNVRRGHMVLIKADEKILEQWKRRHDVYVYGEPEGGWEQ